MALVFELERLMEAPPVGAGPLSVTLKIALLPPTTVAGFGVTLTTPRGPTVRVAVCVLPLQEAVKMTLVEEAAVCVVIVKVACVWPAGTVTLAGTVATLVLELVRLTTAPPAGAGVVSVRVAVTGFPPRMELVERVRDEIPGATAIDTVDMSTLWPELTT